MNLNRRKLREEIETRFNGYVVAVSGGVDSMWLVDFMQQTSAPFVVAHFNHGNNPSIDDRDEAFVRQYCERRGLTLCVGRGDGSKINAAASIEQECRNQRYAYLQGLLNEHGYDRIVTAHTLDDNVENVLMRLTRGVPFDKLHMQEDNTHMRIYRPLLGVKKDDLIKWCTKNNIAWMEDPSNQDIRFERNWWRNVAIPFLRQRRNIDVIGKVAHRMNRQEYLAQLALQADEE